MSLPFTEKEKVLGRACFLSGGVLSLDFAEGTYQIEVKDREALFWPFLQISDEGEILDAFCTCQEEGHCFHLAAAYFAVFKGGRKPLHCRFRESFWNQLCWIASKKHGYRSDRLIKGKGWEARSLTNELLFSVRPITKEGESKLLSFLSERTKQTEENSLKFSNLSEQELLLWREKRPSDQLRYALSFWLDLAKWFFFLQEEGDPYEIVFSPEESLPTGVHIRFSSVELFCVLSPEDFPLFIPSLKTVRSSLSVSDRGELDIQSVQYDRKNKCFLLHKNKEGSPPIQSKGYTVGDWRYVPGKGFFPLASDPLLSSKNIATNEMERFLSAHLSFLRTHLQEPFQEEMHKAKYHLFFDEESSLHVDTYLFAPGDLVEEEAALFGRWAYLPKKGFCYLFPLPFPEAHTIVPKGRLSDFVENHKRWLHGVEGFQPHVMNIEANLFFSVEENGDLLFHSHIDLVGQDVEALEFERWIFIPGKGFFPKKTELLENSLSAGQRVQKQEVSSFCKKHAEELQEIEGFFSPKSPIESVGLHVRLRGKKILVSPSFSFADSYEDNVVQLYGDYTYVLGEGFARIKALPVAFEKYLQEVVISEREEGSFVQHLKELQPWIVELDPKLSAPKKIKLNLEDVDVNNANEASQWLVDLHYKTDLGVVAAYDIWEAIHDNKEFLFSPAGLLDLSNPRFQWLRALPKKRWSRQKKKASLTALEWIRLQTVEDIVVSPDKKKVQELLDSFQSQQGMLPFTISALQSQLRTYQETGAKWLWFLYSYGLSGLLCDEMGLGKTHQAMALLASASALPGAPKKFLVVCPTSVIYHWEELLRRFLPSLSVKVFHGPGRSKDLMQESSYDILLTSYGMIRSDKKILMDISFDIAIYDEIQNAKNGKSLLYKALRALSVRVAIGLTGTPIENRITELKSLIDLVLPHYFPSDAVFKEHFVIPIEKEGDKEKKQLLSQLVRPFILRRKKNEVLLELPEKTEEIAYCDLSDEQKRLYQEFYYLHKGEVKQEVERRSGGGGMHIFALFSKLKQICDHPCLLTGELGEFSSHASGKWDLFVELLQEARESGQKVVVFTQYLAMMDIIQNYLQQQGIGFAQIRGSTRNRKEALERFRADPDCEVFVASLQAAGVGIDLTAASVVIHYDRWWNPAKENQATDRVHRIGQSRGVQVFKLVTKKTIEERIHDLIVAKQGLLEGVVGFDEQDVIKRFTREEILSLFTALEEDL